MNLDAVPPAADRATMLPGERSHRHAVRMHWAGLWFLCEDLEQAYRGDYARTVRVQARAALLVGVLLYTLSAILDVWISHEALHRVWWLRGTVLGVGLSLVALTFSRHFHDHDQAWLMLAGVVAGVGLVILMGGLPAPIVNEYFPGLILVMFWVFLFAGVSFLNALLVNLLILVSYNLLFVLGIHVPGAMAPKHNFYLFTALIIGGGSAYLLERQRRQLYLRRSELEDERNRHRDMALRDHLTDLPNRHLMEQRLEHALARGRRHGTRGAGLFIDIDHFKAVNDTYGHEAGDRVLRLIGNRLQDCVRETDTVARFGGDEFFLLLEGLDGPEFAKDVAVRIVQVLSEPLPIDEADPDGPRCMVGASIGICEFPDTVSSAAEVIDYADRAMYEVKRSGRNGYSFYGAVQPGRVVHPTVAGS